MRRLLAFAVLLAGLGAYEAQSAVRLCYPPVSSGLQEGKTEQEARAMAISAWITEASRYGQAYAAWRLAAGKLYSCSQTTSGAFQCIAKAEPCAVSQVPPPPGSLPPRKPQGVDG